MKMNSPSCLVPIALVFFSAIIFPISSYTKEIQGWDGSFAKLHAFVPIVLHKEGFYPVVGVKKNRPLIDVGGRLVSLEKNTDALFWASDSDVKPVTITERSVVMIDRGLGAGSIDDENMRAGLLASTILTGKSGGPSPGVSVEPQFSGRKETGKDLKKEGPTSKEDIQYWEIIKPILEPLKDAYGVYIFYSGPGIVELKWRSLKDTAKGEECRIQIPYPNKKILREHPKLRYMLLVFQDGDELVPLDHSERNQFLLWNERLSMSLNAKVYEENNRKQTIEPALIFRPSFILSKSDYEYLKEEEISAHITLGTNGTVSKAYLSQEIEPSIASKLLRSVHLWKFFPAIREGKLAEQEIVLPLEF